MAKRGTTRRRIQRNVRATKDNLSVDEKIVENLRELHGVSYREGWTMLKKKLMFKELPE